MINVGYLHGSRADASEARRESRPDFDNGGAFGGHQPGVITAVLAPGVYQVGIIADGDGSTDTVIDNVRAFPAAHLNVDDLVWLVWTPGNPVPMIQVSGGGSGASCFQSYTEWGALFG